ncbi:CaiB/BaiF CoA-transferase family protein [Rossellomorea aquimaris]|uniref:CoA transferase n=1 Tax=Rossellomorea aquimaris TaxID=189382 RepID=A0A5D4U2I7_9BACI|nr:CoA transferase [Rossellomorea aquimaris]TYS81534.1 CoA transferase [Rossellomorea aquimaris]TYS88155.1 CoA transferase [Rossellomorea aquimaris]
MLKGIQVIDFTNYIPGPFTTLRLAELGAEVIKIESPEGDPARHNGNGLVFNAHNRGKKSIVLNLKQEEGRKIALDLIEKADVLIESFRPGVMEKLGLGYKEVMSINPAIVYCSITGYGNSGKMSQLGSHDLNYMSVSGALAQLKDKSGRPVHPSHIFADYIGGLTASERILAGLVARGISGEGSYHCVSLAESMASLMTNHVLIEKETGYPRGIQVLNGNMISYGLYETKDKGFVSLAALEPKFWRNFCLALGREDWLSAHYSKPETENPIYCELVDLFRSKTRSEWSVIGQEVDCCLTPVLDAGELVEYPVYKEKGFVTTDGQVNMYGDLNRGAVTPPPEKGGQTKEILRAWLDVTDEQILDWEKQGVID